MKLTWHGHSAFRIEAGEAKILIDSFLSDNPSRDKTMELLPYRRELDTER
jgi:L-ascorbate metabolism protein UlaG (beta-lactamase superfamily)